MTREEIRAMWARWSHRSDLAADLDAIEALAIERVRDRFMIWGMVFDDMPVEDMMADAPALFCAAGLIEIHRLAEDDAGMAREGTMFEGAASDYLMRRSLRAGPAVMSAKRSYPDGN